MHKFAEYLTDYMNKNNISYRKAAIAINIDRTQLRRYVIGERLPKDEGIVKEIAKGIDMSEEEAHLLFKYYERSKMGEQKYRWYKAIGKILNENIKKPDSGRTTNVAGKDNSDSDNLNDTSIVGENPVKIGEQKTAFVYNKISDRLINLNKKEDIDKMMKVMCCHANNIKIMLQTRIYHFYDSIYEAVQYNDDCIVEHIVQLNNINSNEDISDVKIFENIYGLVMCGRSYRVYYTYNDYNDNMTDNYIITDKGLLIFNTFEGKTKDVIGIYTDKKEIISYYMSKFKKCKNKSYVYGYSGKDTAPEEYSVRNMLEGKNSRIGIYKTENRQGIWIHDNRKHGGRDVYIEEENILYNFNMYANDYYNINKN